MVYPVRGIVQGARLTGRTIDGLTVAYVAALVTVSSLVAGALVWGGYDLGQPLAVAALAVVAVVADRGSVRVTRTTELTISTLPVLVSAVLFGPLAAGLVGAASQLGDQELTSRSPGRAPGMKWASYTCIRFLSGVATGFAAHSVVTVTPSEFGGLVLATFVGATVGELMEFALSLLTSVVRDGSVHEVVRLLLPPLLFVPPIYTPVVALLAYMYTAVSPWTLALFLLPAMAAQRLYSLYQQERQLAAELTAANAALASANLQFASALIATLDARDQYTAGHSAAVAIYSRDIAGRMGLPAETCDRAYLCGLVHDIGKIGLPAGLIEKPGALTLEERRHMQEHSAIGERILRNVDQYSEIATIVRHHHERVDGQGYPDGLSGDDIPLISRIIAVADAYNAMTSDRPYRDAMPSSTARHRLAQAVESQFDTAVVVAFEAILAVRSEDYRLGRGDEFRFDVGSDAPDPASEPAVAAVA